ncbi:aminoglycoside phosphotransferase [Deinococcus proteolyticus MRP]|uniref:Aminoglycoside phosphotransferase n=1 Tax=Deinococcus proteolyticus (strain ATCC 35074 / DSM 20540 / JCM 6276 / NBRC 101906 / NCIMB 13154 / VKM Ac-1939 / CCM 2703 / MRP) TaxID=693977 RepID=F0RLG5_DEIPM|nr:aminoglycoside phosphotransferase [Deinococcus proteolyticus MRP]
MQPCPRCPSARYHAEVTDGPTIRLPELTARYGPLSSMGTGMQSRVYATADGQSVIKVYRSGVGKAEREAANLRRAGLGHWVVDTLVADGAEALVMRRFEGKRVTAATLPAALPQLKVQLSRLHAVQQGEVDVGRVEERLRKFRRVLASQGLDDLFAAVEGPLHAGEFAQPASFCHLDLWQDNILIDPAGEVMLIDWTNADWDDPLRDLALLKTGTLDLLGADESLAAVLGLLPGRTPPVLRRLRAYLSLTYLHDLYWLMMNEPYEFAAERAKKVPRARHVLSCLPASG